MTIDLNNKITKKMGIYFFYKHFYKQTMKTNNENKYLISCKIDFT